MNNQLDSILNTKRHEVAAKKNLTPQHILERKIGDAPARGFISALKEKTSLNQNAIIAEIKKASPSKGVIAENFDPIEIAKAYESGGASCLSVLTDEQYFQGHDDYLVQAKTQTSLPILRKDFVIDEYQIYESKAIGADCILLIAAALTNQELAHFISLANDLSLDYLLEVHDLTELERAIAFCPDMVGINNRNLQTFKTDLHTSIDLAQYIPKNCLIVTESGINHKADIELMNQNGIYAFLIGESLMQEKDPESKLRELIA